MSTDLLNHNIWHPFTQAKIVDIPIKISSAKAATLTDNQGNEYLDMISSWWVNTHGHCHPKITSALSEQVKKLDHVMFAGFSHEPALNLSSKLSNLLSDKGLSKIFFAENGAFAVETALKIALQYWKNQGVKGRKRFISFHGGYHGDSFGAMSVGKTCGFDYSPFEKHLFSVDFVPFASSWDNDIDVEEKERISLEALKLQILENGKNTAALIVEPLIQAVGGFNFCSPQFIEKVVGICRDNKILVIFDEIMTGFGRTGKMFACDHITNAPDILCLGKAMSGGVLPLSATITSEKVYKTFLSEDINKALIHGSTYGGNALACVAANSSLDLFKEESSFTKIENINKIHHERLADLAKTNDLVTRPRILGSVAAFNLTNQSSSYTAKIGQTLKPEFLKNGLLIRPFGNVVHIVPPYCATEEQLNYTYDKIDEILTSKKNG